jgi:hypothetical protein
LYADPHPFDRLREQFGRLFVNGPPEATRVPPFVPGGTRENGQNHDRHPTPAEIAMRRIDFWAWLESLPRRDRWIARLLAAGEAVRDIATRFGLTPGRTSQMRRALCDSWNVFATDVQGVPLDLPAAWFLISGRLLLKSPIWERSLSGRRQSGV